MALRRSRSSEGCLTDWLEGLEHFRGKPQRSCGEIERDCCYQCCLLPLLLRLLLSLLYLLLTAPTSPVLNTTIRCCAMAAYWLQCGNVVHLRCLDENMWVVAASAMEEPDDPWALDQSEMSNEQALQAVSCNRRRCFVLFTLLLTEFHSIALYVPSVACAQMFDHLLHFVST